jgi:hemolysin III
MTNPSHYENQFILPYFKKSVNRTTGENAFFHPIFPQKCHPTHSRVNYFHSIKGIFNSRTEFSKGFVTKLFPMDIINQTPLKGREPMTRTPLCDRILPNYTKAEELFHMISHIAGGAFGITALILCVTSAVSAHDPYAIVGSAIYGASLIAMYAMSGIYHGLPASTAKKVMQVLDHCTIYFLIGGTYTPILLTAIRKVSPTTAWVLFSIVWGLAILAATLTAIDLKKYAVFSMICYIFMGWCIVFAPKVTIAAIPSTGLWLLLAGGIVYTVGAILYGLGKKHRYMHGTFHLFVVAGSVLQFFCILFYVL